MSAQSWSVKGIDPKVREAVREAAARQGMSLGEYLNQALLNHEIETKDAPPQPRPPLRPRTTRVVSSQPVEDLDDWLLSAPTDMTRNADPARMAHRLDNIERRTQLAVTGLDRAVSTIDRSVLGLAGRVDDAEEVARESADRIADALEQFRAAGEVLSGRLIDAEGDARQSRELLEQAARELGETRDDLTQRAQSADEIARRAELATVNLSRDLQERATALSQHIEDVDADAKYAIGVGLAESRAAAEAAAREAAHAASEAVEEIRALQETMARRLSDSEAHTRDYVATAIENTRTQQEAITSRVARGENEFRRAYDGLSERLAGLETGARFAIDEVATEIRAAQSGLAQRLERIEQASREGTAGLRQAAGAAIADLRNAQLGLSARLKLVEESSGASVDFSEFKDAQAALAERLTKLESAPDYHADLSAIAARLERVESAEGPDIDGALAAFDAKLGALEARLSERTAQTGSGDDALHARLDEIWSRLGAHDDRVSDSNAQVRTLEDSLHRLAERLAETESTANTAIRTLEQTIASVEAKTAGPDTAQQTEAVRQVLEQRLNDMAQATEAMIHDLRTELVDRANAARDSEIGAEHIDGLEGAVADVNRRLAAAERRQAQTIEAISIEIKRMSETVDRRLRAVETKGDGDPDANAAVREEVSRLARALEARFEEIERREAAAFDRMGLEVGRLSERLEDRFAAVEGRSAQAIEQVGEQVARMAERFNQRQEGLARELGERVLDGEERSNARIADAISGIMHRLSEVEAQSVEAVTPVARAMSTVASRLQALENNNGAEDDMPTPARRIEDRAAPPPSIFGEPLEEAPPVVETPPPPMAFDEPSDDDYYDLNDDEPLASFQPPAEPPVRAGPIAPGQRMEIKSLDLDAFTEDERVIAPPPEDDDPFWTPESDETVSADGVPSVAAEDDALFADELEPLETPAPAEKADYLSAARRAAQAQSSPAKGKDKKPAKAAKAPKTPSVKREASPSLRGSSRVVFWGAAGAIALLVSGGAYVLSHSDNDNSTVDNTPPQPQSFDAAPAAPPVAPFDSAAPSTEATAIAPPADPAAAPASAAPASAAAPAQTPVADAHPVEGPRVATAVAAPVAQRSVSLEQAAARGDAVAQYELALQRLTASRTQDGVTLLRQSANQGLAMAQYRLAKLYERGEGVPADLNMARSWTERAAAAGNRRAMHDLGVYFARGEGAPLDEAAAFRWFRQAAELGVADSQFNLGVLYQQGRGVGANPAEALFWFLVAARQGDEDAGARATALESQLQPIQVEQARARASAFRPRAASARANGEFGPRPWAASPARS